MKNYSCLPQIWQGKQKNITRSIYLNNINRKTSHRSQSTGRNIKMADVVRIINVQNVSCKIYRNGSYLHAQVRSTG